MKVWVVDHRFTPPVVHTMEAVDWVLDSKVGCISSFRVEQASTTIRSSRNLRIFSVKSEAMEFARNIVKKHLGVVQKQTKELEDWLRANPI